MNLWGYGYTEAGQTITYTLHYENVGDADAHDVRVIDVLEPDLDAASVVPANGGTWDAATRTMTWLDPVAPPLTPRLVSFTAAVRAYALPGTRVRNVATVVFPDAVPPTRIDTNFVEHVIPSPDAPASITDAQVRFGHPDDRPDGTLRAVIPFAVTTSLDTVATRSDGDPCAELPWTITWRDGVGNADTIEVGSPAPQGECGCSCTTTGNPASGLPGLLAAVVALRRRRRGPY